MKANIILDVSRLLSRAGRSAATGIDRVELAYAKHLIANARERLSFAAVAKWGVFGPLPEIETIRFIEDLDQLWRDRASAQTSHRKAIATSRRLQVSLSLRGEAGLHRRIREMDGAVVYLLVSHHHLDRSALIRRLKSRAGAKFACFIHDTIPIDFPEYARPGEAERHRRRMRNAAQLADAIIVNSEQTREAFSTFLARENRAPPPLLCAPLGVDLPDLPKSRRPSGPTPYFVCVGTIEPKKNHLLLLNVWREFGRRGLAGAPRLVLIGQRGWYVEAVANMLDRSTALLGLVEERNSVSDAEMTRMIAGACALLMPTFAEGYGLPVAEALALGVPALCSDLPSLRDVGGEAPEYLDPLDPPAWRQAILDYARPGSTRREAQLARIVDWRPPSWDAHFDAVDRLLEIPAVALSDQSSFRAERAAARAWGARLARR